MKLTTLVVTVGLCAGAAVAHAGGLFVPGAGAESTSRAGASLAACDDGECLALNPAGLAKSEPGTEITVSAVIIDYVMQFTRAGTYDMQTDPSATPGDNSYAGTNYPTIHNTAKPAVGFGAYQAVPVIAITSDLGGAVKGLHVGAGLYAPNAYPSRDMTVVNGKQFVFNESADSDPPPPTRYDIMKQSAAVEIPSVAASYRILDNLDVGARFGLAFAQLESTVALWGMPDNYTEWVKQDGQVHVKASWSCPSYSAGATFRPAPAIELAANYTSGITVNASGTAQALNGPNVSLAGAPIMIAPTTGPEATCKPNSVGTADALNACVGFQLPQSAQIGARYKFLDATGKLRGDVELDLDWENWGATGGTSDGQKLDGNDYAVTIDAQVETAGNTQTGIALKPSIIYHDFQDTYGVRLGGSYIMPMGGNDLIVRGGAGYDTAAAKPGWERADIDGAARTTLAAGVGYKMHRVQIDAGFGVVLEGTQTNPNAGPNGMLCNPTSSAMGCVGTNMDQAQANRHGPDPTNPLLPASLQTENPVNQGTFVSHYVMFMLGAKTWF